MRGSTAIGMGIVAFSMLGGGNRADAAEVLFGTNSATGAGKTAPLEGGTIGAAQAVAVTDAFRSAAVGLSDMDGDGRVDLVYGNGSGRFLRWVRRTGPGPNDFDFANPKTIDAATPNGNMEPMAIGDVNGDGTNDIVVSFAGSSSSVSATSVTAPSGATYTNVTTSCTGNSFASGTATAESATSWSSSSSTCKSSLSIYVYLNPASSPGTGFTRVVVNPGLRKVAAIAGKSLADFTGDRRLDLAVFTVGSSGVTDGHVQVYVNTGDPAVPFAAGQSIGVPKTDVLMRTGNPRWGALAAVDADGDCVPDLWALGNTGIVYIYKNLGGGLFAPPVAALSLAGVAMDRPVMDRADVNGDGFADLLLASGASADGYTLRLYRNQGKGLLVPDAAQVISDWGTNVAAEPPAAEPARCRPRVGDIVSCPCACADPVTGALGAFAVTVQGCAPVGETSCAAVCAAQTSVCGVSQSCAIGTCAATNAGPTVILSKVCDPDPAKSPGAASPAILGDYRFSLRSDSHVQLKVGDDNPSVAVAGTILLNLGRHAGDGLQPDVGDPVELSHVSLTGADFGVSGATIKSTKIVETMRAIGSITSVAGSLIQFELPPYSLRIVAQAIADPDWPWAKNRTVTARLSNPESLAGSFDTATGELTIDGGGNDGLGNNATIVLRAHLDNQRPVPSVSAPATVECTTDRRTTIAFDASASTDPDGILVAEQWTEVLGPGRERGLQTSVLPQTVPQANVRADLPFGVRVIRYRVYDDFLSSSFGDVSVAVVDTVPPVLVPPAGISVPACSSPLASDPGSTSVDLGVPTADDSCDPLPRVEAYLHEPGGGLSRIENPRVVSLPPGVHQIEWRAADWGGNQTVAFQQVTVGPCGSLPVTLVEQAAACRAPVVDARDISVPIRWCIVGDPSNPNRGTPAYVDGHYEEVLQRRLDAVNHYIWCRPDITAPDRYGQPHIVFRMEHAKFDNSTVQVIPDPVWAGGSATDGSLGVGLYSDVALSAGGNESPEQSTLEAACREAWHNKNTDDGILVIDVRYLLKPTGARDVARGITYWGYALNPDVCADPNALVRAYPNPENTSVVFITDARLGLTTSDDNALAHELGHALLLNDDSDGVDNDGDCLWDPGCDNDETNEHIGLMMGAVTNDLTPLQIELARVVAQLTPGYVLHSSEVACPAPEPPLVLTGGENVGDNGPPQPPPPDGGTGPGSGDSGCGCRTGSEGRSPPWCVALAVLVPLLRRRGHGHA